MGRDGQANAPQEVVLLLCLRDELLVVRPRIIAMTPALSRYLDVLRFAAAFTGAGPAPAPPSRTWATSKSRTSLGRSAPGGSRSAHKQRRPRRRPCRWPDISFRNLSGDLRQEIFCRRQGRGAHESNRPAARRLPVWTTVGCRACPDRRRARARVNRGSCAPSAAPRCGRAGSRSVCAPKRAPASSV
jgi:hypothetical protein